MRSLAVASVSIRNFRNLSMVDVELGTGFNVFWGDNGQGKTNVLEAVYVLATSRSFRTSRIEDLIGPCSDTSSIRGRIVEQEEDREQSMGLRRGVRVPRVDGRRPQSLADYALRTPAVVFHPGAIVLSSGAGSERRRLLDRLALYAIPASLDDAAMYGKAMRARQRVLEKRGEGAADLDGWESLMAHHGCSLTNARAEAAERFIPAAELAFERIGPKGSRLGMRYVSGGPTTVDAFLSELRRRRPQDRARGAATAGPHRDDLALSLGGREVRAMASQGQHRSVVLALELAEIGVVERCRGVRPVLLLDDVSSELDRARTTALLAALHEQPGQVILTTTRPELLDGGHSSYSDGRMNFRVVAGDLATVN